MRGFYQLEVGLDMGWTSFRYEVRDEADRRIERGGEESTPAGLRRVLAKYQGKERVRVSYEAGTQMYWVDEVVKGMGMESYPFHAASFALIVKSRNKTDKKDAETIARAAVKEILPAKIVVAEESEELREKYRRRSGIEATNAQLKRVLKIGRLRVRRLTRVRHAVTLKALGWNIRQAVRARKA